jgi:threonine dehydrogenase-like Zn-dependent dehydrogenase
MYKDILVKSVNLWLADIIVGILPSFKNNPTMNKMNNVMGSLLGLDLSNYSILSEFSFLIPSLLGNYVNGYVTQFINSMGIADKDIPAQVNNIINSCIQQCRNKGHINIFGLQFEENAFNNFNKIFTDMVNNTNINISHD